MVKNKEEQSIFPLTKESYTATPLLLLGLLCSPSPKYATFINL